MAGQVIGAVGDRKPGPDRARGGRGIGAAGHRRRTAHRQRRARRTDPAGNGEGSEQRQQHPTDARPRDPDQRPNRCWPKSAKPTRRRARRRSSIDPRTSQILAMANWPPVNPDDLAKAQAAKTCSNRATGFNYEPGSTFKAFTVSAALEEKLVTPETDIHPAADDPGRRPDDRRRRAAPDRER